MYMFLIINEYNNNFVYNYKSYQKNIKFLSAADYIFSRFDALTLYSWVEFNERRRRVRRTP